MGSGEYSNPRGMRLRREQSSSDGLQAAIFRDFLSPKVNARIFFHNLRFYPLSLLPSADRTGRCDTRSKWPWTRNPDKSWWHRHSTYKVFLAVVHGSIMDSSTLSCLNLTEDVEYINIF